ncbi:nuclear transport factor 2 family protein [Aurantiacibacter xanthus]|uniref:Nuclear transport factor 2 family protein n=1 Tax=Aurantiacibacter xanthus TaxID=1784712 RepID=A0A3A1PEP9_9SPHN|nr:nuclear transport factor 2 family protein [Aurantiacibacter xanthus]RIV91421.1 nuclear transport factor 2 family protein [Aurantiacibacter xanthus]
MRILLAMAALALPASVQAQSAAQSGEIAALDARVTVLEGTREVRNLQRAFGYFMDRGLWRQAAQLFADDGTIEIGLDGVYRGPERIEHYLRLLHGGQEGLIYGQLNEWVTLQPMIAVAPDGLSASARWRDLGMLGQYKSHAEWRDGIYENTYVKGADGKWRIASLTLYVNFVVPYKEGWARLEPGEGLTRSQASMDFPPDASSSVDGAAFPAVNVPPFAIPHPVTGREVRR